MNNPHHESKSPILDSQGNPYPSSNEDEPSLLGSILRISRAFHRMGCTAYKEHLCSFVLLIAVLLTCIFGFNPTIKFLTGRDVPFSLEPKFDIPFTSFYREDSSESLARYNFGLIRNSPDIGESYLGKDFYVELSTVAGDVNKLLALAVNYYTDMDDQPGIITPDERINYRKAFVLFNEAAKMDRSGLAHRMIGLCYEFGNGVRKNHQKAFENYEISSKMGNVFGKLCLAVCYYNGIGCALDYKESFALFREAAKDEESGIAYYMLGVSYGLGRGVAQDLEKAFEYYDLAAQKKNINGILQTIYCYYSGTGIEKNQIKALELFSAVMPDLTPADRYYFMGTIYEYSEGAGRDIRQAFENYKLSAEEGDVRGKIKVAHCLHYGIGVEKDAAKAFELASEVAQMQFVGDVPKNYLHGEAFHLMGVSYEHGNGTGKDPKKAFECYTRSAENGNIDGIINLAYCYYNGAGVERNAVKAFELFNEAAQNDLTGDACYRIGSSFLNGAEQDLQKTFKYITLSAGKGSVQGKVALAVLYYFGIGIDKNHKIALALLYELTQEDRNGDALGVIGLIYEFSEDVTRDIQKAFEYYKLSAEKGSAIGKAALAHYNHDGTDGEKGVIRASKILDDIAQEFNVDLHLLMGSLYESGKGVEQDFKKAFEYYTLSAEKGSVDGKIEVAYCYYNGVGVEKDFKKAFWLMNTVAQEDRTGRAFYAMGGSYEYGEGVEQNSKKAFECYRLSAEKGNIDGKLAVAYCFYNAFGTEKDAKKAFEIMSSIAQDDNTGWAFYEMGVSYEYGNGVERDSRKAFEHYAMSAEKENLSGRLSLARCYYHGLGVVQNFFEAFKQYEEIGERDESGHALRMQGLCYEFGNGIEQNLEKAAEYYRRADDMRLTTGE